MQHVLIIHEVDVYPAWKTVFAQIADTDIPCKRCATA